MEIVTVLSFESSIRGHEENCFQLQRSQLPGEVYFKKNTMGKYAFKQNMYPSKAQSEMISIKVLTNGNTLGYDPQSVPLID